MSLAPRALRTIEQKLDTAVELIARGAIAGIIAAFAAAIWAGKAHWFEHADRIAGWYILLAIILVGAALIMRRLLSRAAAVTVVASYLALCTTVLLNTDIPVILGYQCLLGGIAIAQGLRTFHIPTLVRELQALADPRDPKPGDLMSVIDGEGFGVVKVLAVEPARVHVRQYGVRFPFRPWHVFSAYLAGNPQQPGVQSFAHLPLDRTEFLRWAPLRLRTEPLSDDERAAMAAWEAQQQ